MESKFIDWSHLLLLVLLLTLHRCIHAQSATSTAPSFGLSLRDNLKASFSTVMVVAFLSAFVFMGFFSLYLRHCTNSYVSTRNPIAAAADILRGRLHREAINKCPILIYSAVRDLQMGKSPLECAVCLGEFQDKDKIRLLPKCHHVFHPDCIDAWFISHLTCPVCRATLTSPDCSDNAGVGVPMASNPDESGESEAQISTTESQEPPARTILVGETGTTSSSSSSSSARLAQTSPPTQSRVFERLPRSHSTGHSLFMESEEMTDRYALRLPEHGRGQITANHGGIRRSASSDVVLPGVWSSKRGWHKGEGEGCGHMERWAFSSMTPPFVKSSMENTETSSSHRPPV